MDFLYKPIMLLLPFFLLLIGLEALYAWQKGYKTYSHKEILANFAIGIGHNLSGLLTGFVIASFFMKAYEWRLFDIPLTWWSIPLLLIGQDFIYYWFHRWNHECRWLWASHIVHHSSENLNLSTSFRLGWTGLISLNWIFWLPLVFLGFHPATVFMMVSLNLAFQFFIHTQFVKKLGWWELIFNSPSHHRVHHAANPIYLDRNYGGILIIWDRLFGTFVEEDLKKPCRYGIYPPIKSNNPFVIAFREWGLMIKDVLKPVPFSAKLKYLFGPPGWSHDGSKMTTKQIREKKGLIPAAS